MQRAVPRRASDGTPGPAGPQGPAGLPGDNPNISLGSMMTNTVGVISSVVGWTGPNQSFAAGDWYVKGYASFMLQAMSGGLQIPFAGEMHLSMGIYSGIESGGVLVSDLGSLVEEIRREVVVVNSSPIYRSFNLEKLVLLPEGDYHLEIHAFMPTPRDPVGLEVVCDVVGMQAFFWP